MSNGILFINLALFPDYFFMSLMSAITFSIWLLSEILLNRLFRSKSSDRQNADKNSLSLIWITIIASISASVFISNKYYLPLSQNPIIQYAGLELIFAGIILRLAVIISLGRFFTVDVTIRQNHQLKKNGFYKYLRHPSYSASLLSFIGLGIFLNNWISLLLIVVAMLTVFIIRITIEEKILMEQFGSDYIEYKKTTRRLIPFIY